MGGKSYVLDTSALLAFWSDEAGADEVERILRTAPTKAAVHISFMTVMEARYLLLRRPGEQAVQEFDVMVRNLPIARIDVTDEILNHAARIKASSRLSVADSWIIATAMATDSALIHKDPEFEQVREQVTLIPLPYKPKSHP
jgi:predicted nucleic acid-binding protein